MKTLKVSEKAALFLSRFHASSILTLLALIAVVVGMSVVGVAEAHADRSGGDSRVWVDRVRSAQRALALDYELVDLATNQLDTHTRAELEAIALDQAQIWGDTILEGDFAADEVVTLDLVQRVMQGGEFLGYRITYSSKAWDTSGCRAEHAGYDPDCIEGRIAESTFVAPGLNYWFRDHTALAEFFPGIRR